MQSVAAQEGGPLSRIVASAPECTHWFTIPKRSIASEADEAASIPIACKRQMHWHAHRLDLETKPWTQEQSDSGNNAMLSSSPSVPKENILRHSSSNIQQKHEAESESRDRDMERLTDGTNSLASFEGSGSAPMIPLGVATNSLGADAVMDMPNWPPSVVAASKRALSSTSIAPFLYCDGAAAGKAVIATAADGVLRLVEARMPNSGGASASIPIRRVASCSICSDTALPAKPFIRSSFLGLDGGEVQPAAEQAAAPLLGTSNPRDRILLRCSSMPLG